MGSSVFIFVHGYSETDRGRPTTRVWDDRLSAAEKVAQQYTSIGVDDIRFLFIDDTLTTQDTLYSYAQETGHPVVEEFHVEQPSRKPNMNTRDEILAVCALIQEKERPPAFVVSVSSRDHTPRIMRYWTEVQTEGALPDSVIATVVGSEDSYTLDGGSPITLERAKYQELCAALDNIFDIPDEQLPKVAKDVDQRIQTYLESDSFGP